MGKKLSKLRINIRSLNIRNSKEKRGNYERIKTKQFSRDERRHMSPIW